MQHDTNRATVAVIGGGVVGAAILFTLAHRGVDAVLLEAEDDLAYGASGTNSGMLHTGFDSVPGELETELILRAATIRSGVIEALGLPVIACGAVLVPKSDEDHETVLGLEANARENGVEAYLREEDGALVVPGESVTDPVAFTLALAASAAAAGARVETNSKVTSLEASEQGASEQGVRIGLQNGRTIEADVAINAAGLYADEVAALAGDRSFSVYPRKGEFFVFELPGGETLDRIILPVPTKRTKGVLVFPTIDGRVVAGPTAVDLDDKTDWSVREEAKEEILAKAVAQFPHLEGLEPIASYAGLRPAGRDVNYVIEPSQVSPRLINVAAIRSTGLTASLGIGDYVAGLVAQAGVEVRDALPAEIPAIPGVPAASPQQPGAEWWLRTAQHRHTAQHRTTSAS